MYPSSTRPRRRRGVAVLLALALSAGSIAALHASPAQAATTVTINGTATGRTLDGVGAISGGGGNSRLLIDYPEPQRTQILDYLFKPGYGAAVQMLKVEIGGDTNSTSGAEPSHEHTRGDLNCGRGYEWWLMAQAKARNPAIKLAALTWGAPGWIGNGDFWSTDMVNYLLAWLNCAKGRGLTVDYLGGWNERGYNTGWYESLRSALNSNGFGGVKVVAADDASGWAVADTVVNDSAFAAAVDVIGTHYVCGYRTAQSTCPSSTNAVASGKTLWASENGSDDYNAGAQALARGINRDYIDGKMTAYLNWPIVAAITPNIPYATMGVAVAPSPWSGYYSIGKSAWVMAQTTQFTAAGWRYLDAASGYLGGNRANGSYVTLKSTNNVDYSTVIETMDATASQTFTATVSGGLSTGTVHVWSTNVNSANPSDYFVHASDVTPTNGSFTLTLQPGFVYTVTTTTGQGKGSATSPAQTAMPLPYSDTYDSSTTGTEARYLMDQQGSFEVSTCGAGRGGNCVRQMSAQAPITWDPLSDPYALLGDTSWGNYTVASDVLLEQAGYAELIGRATWQHSFGPAGLDAYYLRVSNTGAWSILRNNTDNAMTTVASGTVAALGTNTWHRLGLTFSGSTITAVIDGATVRSVTDSTWTAGQIGFGTSQGGTAQFDNLSITAGQVSSTFALVGTGSGRCLDDPGWSQTNGIQLNLWDCNGGGNQSWTLTSGNQLSLFGTKCLQAGTTQGSAAQISDCASGTAQQWTLNSNGTVTNVASGLCLDASGAGTTNGTPVIVWACSGNTNQLWTRR